MKIIGWTWYGNPDYVEMFPIGLNTEPNCDWNRHEVEKVIVEELRNKGYRFTGDYHQNGDFGVPIFDNGMVATFTKRQWGALMYKAYPNEEGYEEGLEYVKWAWNWLEMNEEDRVFPHGDEN